MTKKQSTSLHSLYEQRKSEHPLPQLAKDQLLKKANQKRSLTRWKPVIPSVAASLLVLVILWPMQKTPPTTMDTLSAPAERELMMTDAPMMSDEILEESFAIEQDSVDLSPARQSNGLSAAAPIAEPQMKLAPPSAPMREEAKSTLAEVSEPSITLEDEESRVGRIVALTQDQAPMLVFVEAVEPRILVNCRGEQVTLDAELDVSVGEWILLTWRNEQWIPEPQTDPVCVNTD